MYWKLSGHSYCSAININLIVSISSYNDAELFTKVKGLGEKNWEIFRGRMDEARISGEHFMEAAPSRIRDEIAEEQEIL